MTSESGQFKAEYDVHYNLKELNGISIQVDDLNQIEGFSYDLNGRLLRPGFVYDAFDQLIQARGEKYIYDALGRRLSRGAVSFLYIGDEEVGAFEGLNSKELKVWGLTGPVAIEIDGKPYAPVQDVQGTIRMLVDDQTGKVFKENDCDAFGAGVTAAIPYAYAGKRYDPQTGLLYFGHRYYDPTIRRWLTPDPIGPADHSNFYQYVFNNPFYYQDPDGQFAFAIPLLFWGAELALPALSAWVAPIVIGAVTGIIAYEGYQLVQSLSEGGYEIPIDISFPSTLEKRSSPPGPDPRAEGTPHTTIESIGPGGQYTTHNGDGTWKQYRGSGKPHGPIPRPNVKENKNNPSPSGPRPGIPNVREPRPDEIPTGKIGT
jgi:RHS repeat-associated protein